MPLNELNDYIKILNEVTEEEENEIRNSSHSSNGSNINDVKMAGNTLPGGIF